MRKKAPPFNEATTQKSGSNRLPLPLGKRICTTAEVLQASLGRPRWGSLDRTGPTHEQIAERAYFLWQQNGELTDQHEACWLQAEAELRREG